MMVSSTDLLALYANKRKHTVNVDGILFSNNYPIRGNPKQFIPLIPQFSTMIRDELR